VVAFPRVLYVRATRMPGACKLAWTRLTCSAEKFAGYTDTDPALRYRGGRFRHTTKTNMHPLDGALSNMVQIRGELHSTARNIRCPG
jgi:hypothetical protein